MKENKAIQQVIDDIKENITSGHIDIKALKEKIYKLRGVIYSLCQERGFVISGA